jgi:TetR/AcrR family transcriptional regulator, tetracycline repressor protein
VARELNRERIVGAALAVLDEKGIDGVTVRAVAAHLGVKAPALYYHIRDKQELLDEMGTEITRRVVTELRGHAATGDWLDDLVAYAGALRAEYLTHRDGARTFSGTKITDPEVLRAQEPWLQRWVASGVPAAVAFDAFELTTAFVVGFVIEEQERLQSTGDPSRYSLPERDHQLGPGAPLVSEAGHARVHSHRRFERQLHTLVTGIRAGGDPPS